MGCDIHLFVERRTDDGWRLYLPAEHEARAESQEAADAAAVRVLLDRSEDRSRRLFSFWTGRNYQLFGLLAGVRGEGPVLRPRRGLPADLSSFVADYFAYWSSDIHSASWYLLEELLDERARLREADAAFERGFEQAILDDLPRYDGAAAGSLFRIVFGFDN